VRRVIVAVLNTAALVLIGLALAAVLCGAWLTWGTIGAVWAAVPCAVIAAALAFWLGVLAEGEEHRDAQSVHRNARAPGRRS